VTVTRLGHKANPFVAFKAASKISLCFEARLTLEHLRKVVCHTISYSIAPSESLDEAIEQAKAKSGESHVTVELPTMAPEVG